ncbi:ferritin-like domain-containing protein [Actinocatenispora sera]|uniref:ferritin-like domain-containing protein n=1 Tax=Actinocatenispora sera TaxID=390989 RepID=UPI0033C7BB99
MTPAQQRLQQALAAEHAAVYGYDVLGPRLTGAEQTAARNAEQAHRDRRDALTLALTKQRVTPVAAAPGYALPRPVTDRASALRLAVSLEERTAEAWGAGLPALSAAQRRQAIEAISDCAVRATRWRRVARITPATVPFPGRP